LVEAAAFDQPAKPGVVAWIHLSDKVPKFREVFLCVILGPPVAVEYNFINGTGSVARGATQRDAFEREALAECINLFGAIMFADEGAINLRRVGKNRVLSSVASIGLE
jgi:hypothetical protein